MKCNICPAFSNGVCACGISFCEDHGLSHYMDLNHIVQRVIEKEEARKKNLNEMNKKVTTICRIKREVYVGAANLIKLIGKLSKNYIEKLEGIKVNYLRRIRESIEDHDEFEDFTVPRLEGVRELLEKHMRIKN